VLLDIRVLKKIFRPIFRIVRGREAVCILERSGKMQPAAAEWQTAEVTSAGKKQKPKNVIEKKEWERRSGIVCPKE
jgi:hypothetical protein